MEIMELLFHMGQMAQVKLIQYLEKTNLIHQEIFYKMKEI